MHSWLVHDSGSKTTRTGWALLLNFLGLIDLVQLQTLVFWVQHPGSYPMRHPGVIDRVPGSRHSRVAVVVAVARLATALRLRRVLIAVARLATALSLPLSGLILTGTRLPRWRSLSTRVPLFASLTATTTLVAALSLPTLRCCLLAA